MIKVNFTDGRTQSYDLRNGQDSASLRSVLEGGGSPGVTALIISRRKIMHTFPRPKVLVLEMGAELLIDKRSGNISGEVIWFDVGEYVIKYTAYYRGTKVTRLDVMGKE